MTENVNIDSADSAKEYGRIIAKAWSNPAFKARLLAEPEQVLRETGLELP